MSRSNPTVSENPATRFFEWSGSQGVIQYYDKTIGDNGSNITVPLPFTFLVLDRVAQVGGGVDSPKGYVGFWSNAVKNLSSQPFTVMSKRGVEAKGLYSEIKGHTGIKFISGLYIAYKVDGVLNIGYLGLKGAALTAWIEFTKQYKNIFSGAFSVTGSEQKKKGATIYYEPIFKHHDDISEETDKEAQALDRQLQVYFTKYFAASNTVSDDVPVDASIDDGYIPEDEWRQ